MSKSRRQFLTEASLSILGATVAARAEAQAPETKKPAEQKPETPTPGAPPAFGTAPSVGPEVSPATFAEAERLVNVQMTPAEREQAAGNWRSAMAPLYERRTGPKKVAIESNVSPYSLWDPLLPGEKRLPA